jgi:hypothetical protein
VLVKELSCGLCSQLLLDSRCLPCSHGFCRICLVDFFAASRSVSPRTSTTNSTPGSRQLHKSKKCPLCKYPVPDSFKPTKSMHIENMVDLVVDSLPPDHQEIFKSRRKGNASRCIPCILIYYDLRIVFN